MRLYKLFFIGFTLILLISSLYAAYFYTTTDARDRSDLANELSIKGFNHLKAENYLQAKYTIQLAIMLDPNLAKARYALARVQLEMGETEAAINSNLKAIELKSNYSNPHYELGRIYFQYMRDYKSAIKYYKNALLTAPNKGYYQHGLARAYQEDGDTENAVKHFKIYLQHAKKGEHTHLVRQYLQSVGVEVNNIENDTNALLRERKFDDIESLLSKTLDRREKDEFGQYTKFNSLTSRLTHIYAPLDLLKEWESAKPNSPFVHYCLGEYYLKQAWHARGSSWSSTVVAKGIKKFKINLDKSGYYYSKSIALNPNNPLAAGGAIAVCKGVSCNQEIILKYLDISKKADPQSMRSYINTLNYYFPKWHGDNRFMQAKSLVKAMVKNAPKKSRIWRLPILLHEEISKTWPAGKENYFKQKDVWSEVKYSLSNLQSTFPDSQSYTITLAKYALITSDIDLLNNQLKIINSSENLKKTWKAEAPKIGRAQV